MPIIPDAATFQKSLAMLPISTYEPGEMVIAAGAKLAFHFASRLPQDRRLARRVVAYLTEIVEWESEAAEERGQADRGVARIAANPDRTA